VTNRILQCFSCQFLGIFSLTEFAWHESE